MLIEGKVAAIDILVKKGNRFEIIEVKSKGFDSDNPKFDKGWDEYLEDIAFQKELLQEVFPDAHIDCFLFVPDKAKRTQIDGLNALFELKEVEAHNKFKFYEIEFIGDPELIRKDDFMVKVDVNDEVNKRSSIIKNAIKLYSESLQQGTKIQEPLNINCFSCEYNTGEDKNGYHECWKGMPEPELHIRDVYRLGNIKENKKEPIEYSELNINPTITGDNQDVIVGKIVSKNDGVVHGDFYNVEKLINQAPPELREHIRQLQKKYELLEKENSRFKDEVSELKKIITNMTSQLNDAHAQIKEKDERLYQAQCELIEVYKKKK